MLVAISNSFGKVIQGHTVALMEGEQRQIQKISNNHAQAMAAIVALGQGASCSYVYIPRERDIKPFTGEVTADGSVEDFIRSRACGACQRLES